MYLAMAERLARVLENLSKEGKLQSAINVIEKAAHTDSGAQSAKTDNPSKC